jgi:L-amino acid N-acyltransferase YncA
MEKTETLKEGTKVLIRNLTINDLDRMMKFYRSLPAEDKKYLRVDVTNGDVVAQRIKLIEQGNVFRIIALHGDDVVADGALELPSEEWKRHQGELRAIVARPFQRKGLGMLMMRELYFLAAEKNVEKVVVKMMRPQVAARTICHRLGFREEYLLPDYVKDIAGETQDLIIMTCNLKDLWKEIEHIYSDSDWERCR